MGGNLIDPVTNESLFTFLSEFYESWAGQTIIEVALLVLIICFGFTGNGMVLLAVLKNEKLRSITSILIANLAVTDILFAAGIPFIISTRIAHHWVFGDVVCKLFTYAQFVSGVCSILTLVTISVERYLCVCVSPRRKLTLRQTIIILSFVWLVSLCFPIPVAFAQTLVHINVDSKDFIFCGVQWPSSFHSEIYLGFMATLFFIIPLMVISFFYLRILCVVRKTMLNAGKNNDKSTKKQIRLNKMCVAVVFAFVLMWLPFFVVSFLGVHHKQIKSTHFTITIILALANTCQNPIIYGYFNYRFREQYKKMCCCKCFLENFCRKGQSNVYGTQTIEPASDARHSSSMV
ncbi:hypothetical protein ACJMK2_006078 [Sinanodonta woodiana]|uniref:G-protein coupled receptors family 1 profile domain-containing protein n=1 Tax=Sinanodonta woodiana TaxID=1069815 RepID=A0ABD3VSG7_SINWO